jgi:hypothetical protein
LAGNDTIVIIDVDRFIIQSRREKGDAGRRRGEGS